MILEDYAISSKIKKSCMYNKFLEKNESIKISTLEHLFKLKHLKLPFSKMIMMLLTI